MTSYGVTHALWHQQKSENLDNLAGDLVFFEFATKYMSSSRKIGGFELARMPSDPPPDRKWLDELAVVTVCPGSYAPGTYRLGDLTIPVMGQRRPFPQPRVPINKQNIDDQTRAASFLVYEEACWTLPASASGSFTFVANRAKQKLMAHTAR